MSSDPYDQHMAQYSGYDPYDYQMSGIQKPDAGSTYAMGVGGGAASGAATGSAILPGWGTAIGAGVGALAGLYGSYRAQDTADKNYQNQVSEFNRQKALSEQALRIAEAERQLKNQYDAKASVQNDEDRLLSHYAGYYRGIGL